MGPVVFAAALHLIMWMWNFIDENIQEIDFDQAADFVAFRMLTAQIKRAGKCRYLP